MDDAAASPAADSNPALDLFEARLAMIGAQERERQAKKNMWLAHHYPVDYGEKCVKLGGRHVCRRCAALYPMGIIVAIASAVGFAPWPESWDPAAIWVLCLPATIAFCGEAIGLFRYNAKWQVAMMLITAVAFGRGLGYEFEERWHPNFWGPVIIFGALWFLATAIGSTRRKIQQA